MKKSYTSSYLKIYLWQGAAFIVKFLSLFVVTPFLTKEPSIYGIYAVCISVTIFLNYADLGFLRAGQKYAAEYYARGDQYEEMKYIGFGTFILMIFTIICAVIFIYFGIHPQMLIKGLDTSEKISTGSKLLLILAGFTPFTAFQKMITMVFDIRLDSYINQRIFLLGSIITIGSVLYFFREGNYHIVSYFLFSQIVNAFAVTACFFIAERKYKYNLKQFIKTIRFDTAIYKKSSKLAYSGLYIIIAWIVFYELDQMAIGKFLGAEKVAVFAVAYTFASFFRNIFAIFFTPFSNRVNHFIGDKNEAGLKEYCFQLVIFSAPIVVLPSIAFALISKPFILSWVGIEFKDSIDLAKLFSLIFLFGFSSYPASMMLTAKVKIKEINVISTIQPIIYWSGILITYPIWGLLSFAVFKVMATYLSDAYCLYILLRYLEISLTGFIIKVIYPLVLPLTFMIISLVLINGHLPAEKSKTGLMLVLGMTGLSIVISMLIQYVTSKEFQKVIKRIVGSIFMARLKTES